MPTYPLYDNEGDTLQAANGRPLRDVTIEAALDGSLSIEDLQVHRSALLAQAEIARTAGYVPLAQNFARAAELTVVPRGEIIELMPIHPDRVKIELLPSGEYRYRISDRSGSEVILPRGEVWHLRGLSSDGLMGMSPIELARENLGTALAAQGYGARFFANDAKPTSLHRPKNRIRRKALVTKERRRQTAVT